MYSGKSEELMRRLRRAQVGGKKVAAFKPAIDNRYEVENIRSHNGTQFKCVPIGHPRELTMACRSYDVIGVDEAQFFDYGLQEAVNVVVNYHKKTVILAGLDMTYRKEPWASFPYFLAVADSVDKLTAVCHKCGVDAMYTQRLIDGQPAPFEGDTVQVGGLDSYEARCRSCFEIG